MQKSNMYPPGYFFSPDRVITAFPDFTPWLSREVPDHAPWHYFFFLILSPGYHGKHPRQTPPLYRFFANLIAWLSRELPQSVPLYNFWARFLVATTRFLGSLRLYVLGGFPIANLNCFLYVATFK